MTMKEELCPECKDQMTKEGKKKLKHIIFWAFKEFAETMDLEKLTAFEDHRAYAVEVVKFIEEFVDNNF